MRKNRCKGSKNSDSWKEKMSGNESIFFPPARWCADSLMDIQFMLSDGKEQGYPSGSCGQYGYRFPW